MRRAIPDLSRTEISLLIDEWIFSERDRAILKRRMLDGICFEPLADDHKKYIEKAAWIKQMLAMG